MSVTGTSRSNLYRLKFPSVGDAISIGMRRRSWEKYRLPDARKRKQMEEPKVEDKQELERESEDGEKDLESYMPDQHRNNGEGDGYGENNEAEDGIKSYMHDGNLNNNEEKDMNLNDIVSMIKGMEASLIMHISTLFKSLTSKIERIADRIDKIEGVPTPGILTINTAYSEVVLNQWLSAEEFLGRLDDFAQRDDLSILRDIRKFSQNIPANNDADMLLLTDAAMFEWLHDVHKNFRTTRGNRRKVTSQQIQKASKQLLPAEEDDSVDDSVPVSTCGNEVKNTNEARASLLNLIRTVWQDCPFIHFDDPFSAVSKAQRKNILGRVATEIHRWMYGTHHNFVTIGLKTKKEEDDDAEKVFPMMTTEEIRSLLYNQMYQKGYGSTKRGRVSSSSRSLTGSELMSESAAAANSVRSNNEGMLGHPDAGIAFGDTVATVAEEEGQSGIASGDEMSTGPPKVKSATIAMRASATVMKRTATKRNLDPTENSLKQKYKVCKMSR